MGSPVPPSIVAVCIDCHCLCTECVNNLQEEIYMMNEWNQNMGFNSHDFLHKTGQVLR